MKILAKGDFRWLTEEAEHAEKRNVILLATQKNMFSVYARLITKLDELLRSYSDWSCEVKLHPLESNAQAYFQLNLSETHANQLEIVDGFLTGQVLGNIVDGEAKAAYVEARCLALGANKHAAITMGDGSNDLPMMHGAGLSIAYRAKPIVKEKADLVALLGKYK